MKPLRSLLRVLRGRARTPEEEAARAEGVAFKRDLKVKLRARNIGPGEQG